MRVQSFERKQKQEEKLRAQKDIESHRQAAQLFLARIRETIAQKFRQASHEKQFADVVVEREVPGIGCARCPHRAPGPNQPHVTLTRVYCECTEYYA